jgi:hypothetical protein
MSINNGIKPSIRGFKGLGFNRPRPSSFAFDKAITGNASNPYFLIPSLNGTIFPNNFTMEVWVKTLSVTSELNAIFRILNDSSLPILEMGYQKQPSINGIFTTANVEQNGVITDPDGANTLFTIVKTGASVSIYVNGIFRLISSNNNSTLIQSFIIGQCNYYGLRSFRQKMAKIVMYNRSLSNTEIAFNYGGGNGANPYSTVGVFGYYLFEKAESQTDLWGASPPGTWSSGAWGVRDVSNNNNHLMQVGFGNNINLGGLLVSW